MSEEEQQTPSAAQEAMEKTVLTRQEWMQMRNCPEFRGLVIERLRSRGGATDLATKLAWLGSGTLSFFQECLDLADIPYRQAARDYDGDGDISFAIAAFRAGSEPWFRWAVKNGADLSWKDPFGTNITGFIFHPSHLEAISTFRVVYRFVPAPIIRDWAKGQKRCLHYLKNLNKGKTWSEISQQRNWGGKNAEDHMRNNIERLKTKEWLVFSDPETKAFVKAQILTAISQSSPPSGVKRASPRM